MGCRTAWYVKYRCPKLLSHFLDHTKNESVFECKHQHLERGGTFAGDSGNTGENCTETDGHTAVYLRRVTVVSLTFLICKIKRI